MGLALQGASGPRKGIIPPEGCRSVQFSLLLVPENADDGRRPKEAACLKVFPPSRISSI